GGEFAPLGFYFRHLRVRSSLRAKFALKGSEVVAKESRQVGLDSGGRNSRADEVDDIPNAHSSAHVLEIHCGEAGAGPYFGAEVLKLRVPVDEGAMPSAAQAPIQFGSEFMERMAVDGAVFVRSRPEVPIAPLLPKPTGGTPEVRRVKRSQPLEPSSSDVRAPRARTSREPRSVDVLQDK